MRRVLFTKRTGRFVHMTDLREKIYGRCERIVVCQIFEKLSSRGLVEEVNTKWNMESAIAQLNFMNFLPSLIETKIMEKRRR